MKEQILEQLTALRLELDEIFATLKINPRTKDTAHLAEHFSQNAFMWAGRAKGILGAANPYPQSSDPSSKVIEAAVDTFKGEIVIDQAEDETAFVKRMRKRLGECEKTVQHGLMPLLADHKLYHIAVEQIYVGVVNAKLYLGLRLGEIRDLEAELPDLPPPPPEMTASSGGAPPEPNEALPPPVELQLEVVPAQTEAQTPSQASSEVDSVVPPKEAPKTEPSQQ